LIDTTSWRANKYPGGCFAEAHGVKWNANVASVSNPSWGTYLFVCGCGYDYHAPPSPQLLPRPLLPPSPPPLATFWHARPPITELQPCLLSTKKSLVIVGAGNLGHAGLSDRRAIITLLSRVAASLGARVAVEAPCALLSTAHNGGHQLDCNFPWAMYSVNPTFADDRTSILVEGQCQDWCSGFPVPWAQKCIWSACATCGHCFRAQIRSTHSSSSVTHQYCEARTKQIAGIPFVWYLDASHPYTSVKRWLVNAASSICPGTTARACAPGTYCSTSPAGCSYATMSTSAASIIVRDRVLTSLGLTARSYMTLHIRRGDAKDACNTDISVVAAYLDCSIPASSLLPAQPMKLLIFTDETDRHYLDQLMRRIKDLRSVHGMNLVVPVHADPLILNVLHHMQSELHVPTDNYFVYLVGTAVQDESLLPMERRRGYNCQRCYSTHSPPPPPSP